jgi:outer membrane protein W
MYGYGLMNTGGACGLAGVSCSGHDIRIGINVQYHFRAKTSVDPWVGLGFGYEWLHTEGSGPGGSISQTFRGFEIPGLQLGVDFEVDTSVKLGPFIGYSIGRYAQGSVTAKNALVDTSADKGIANTASHQWLFLGVRGVFNI